VTDELIEIVQYLHFKQCMVDKNSAFRFQRSCTHSSWKIFGRNQINIQNYLSLSEHSVCHFYFDLGLISMSQSQQQIPYGLKVWDGYGHKILQIWSFQTIILYLKWSEIVRMT